MITVIFTLDYEIHGNGQGDPYELMVEPTERILRQFDGFGAMLSIMADVAEILKFRDYAIDTNTDRFSCAAIQDQLKLALHGGHDVQLHLHTSYFNAHFNGLQWVQDYAEYSFADLNGVQISKYLRTGKEYLEQLLRPAAPDYSCFAFRAANWSMQPSLPAVTALVEAGFAVESSVFKYGHRKGLVNFDYSNAFSHMLPWRVDPSNVCNRKADGPILEVPIYSENRWLGAFLSLPRFRRVRASRAYPVSPSGGNSNQASRPRKVLKLAKAAFRRHAWKADMNQCTGRQLVSALVRAERMARNEGVDAPFVLIGHSKLFDRNNERSLQPFLRFVASNPSRFKFGTFRDHGQW